MENVYKQAKSEDAVLRIEYDHDPRNPREEFDNLGTMVHWHRRYNLGEQQVPMDNYTSAKEVLRGECGKENEIIYLPLFLYDHSGISLSTGSFIGRAQHAEWDSGQVGWIYATKEQIRKAYGVKRITKDIRDKAMKRLQSEVEIFDQYVRGSVYGFTLHTIDKEGLKAYLEESELEFEDLDDEALEPFLEETDSCWGFYGSNPKENGISDHIPEKHQQLLLKLA